MVDRLAAALREVSVDRLRARIAELGSIGAAPTGGVTRLGLSEEEEQAAGVVASWLRSIGYVSRRDGVGNLFAAATAAPRILVGSHLDSVPNGGRFDGALGVVAAAEVTQAAHIAGLRLPIEVVGWSGEEGVRFGAPLFGSAAALGLLPESAWTRRDAEGRSARDVIREIFGSEAERAPTELEASSVLAYLELHIEQASELADASESLGVVTRIIGATHSSLSLTGTADHAGTTPLAKRRDALLAAAEAILSVERTAATRVGTTIATVGEIGVQPGAKNVVPGSCTFSLDLRAPDDLQRSAAHDEIRGSIEAICRRRGVEWTEETLSEYPATPMSAEVVAALGAACRELGQEPPSMISWAVHDAQVCARSGIPTGMLFVRSTGGSHNPAEFASVEDCAIGVQALLIAITKLVDDVT